MTLDRNRMTKSGMIGEEYEERGSNREGPSLKVLFSLKLTIQFVEVE